jgi:hypothetical protein
MPSRLWAVCDLDGTLGDCTHRLQYARDRAWDLFHARASLDQPYAAEVALVQAWAKAGHMVAYNTGRTEAYRELTQRWLRHHHLPEGPLFMRANDDRRPSTAAKAGQLQELIAGFQDDDSIAFILEDQDKLVAMWRALGYTCLQPRPGAF